jgi:hypothetical protein
MMWRMLSIGGQMAATEIDIGACTFGQMHMASLGGVYDEHGLFK